MAATRSETTDGWKGESCALRQRRSVGREKGAWGNVHGYEHWHWCATRVNVSFLVLIHSLMYVC
eukprot:12167124-Prorocentrum_lima.AAC.1